MQKILRLIQQKSRYGRVLPYAILSAIVAFVGVRGVGNDSDGQVVDFSDNKNSNIIPTAYADDSDCGGGTGDGCGGSSGGCCFPADSQVKTETGNVAISELQEGDMVVSYDETNNSFVTSRVSKILKHGKETGDAHDFDAFPLMNVVYSHNGEDKSMVIVTANHPVFDESAKAYRPVSEFIIGNSVMTEDGRAVIKQIEKIDEEAYFKNEANVFVYNLTLTDGPPTYLAGGLVVHNKDSDSDCCLPGSAVISSQQGEMPIKEIQEDMEVISYDENNREWTTSVVGEVIVHDGNKYEMHDFTQHALYAVTFEVNGEMQRLVITGNHRCFDAQANTYRAIEEFKTGDVLSTINGDVTITQIDELNPDNFFESEDKIVYNLHMKKGPPNYVSDGVLVHNIK